MSESWGSLRAGDIGNAAAIPTLTAKFPYTIFPIFPAAQNIISSSRASGEPGAASPGSSDYRALKAVSNSEDPVHAGYFGPTANGPAASVYRPAAASGWARPANKWATAGNPSLHGVSKIVMKVPRTANVYRASWVLAALSVIALAWGCDRARDEQVLVLPIVDDRYPKVPLDRLGLWLREVESYFKRQSGVQFRFKIQEPVELQAFFERNFNTIPRDADLEARRLAFDPIGIDSKRNQVLSVLNQQDLTQLNHLIEKYTGRRAASHAEIFEIVRDRYADTIDALTSRGLLHEEDRNHRSATNWGYILSYSKGCDLIITNSPIVEDSLNPNLFIRLAAGGLTLGLSQVGRCALISTYPLLSGDYAREKSIDDQAILTIKHELAHALFYLPEDLDAEQPASLMTPGADLLGKDAGSPLALADKAQVAAALALRKATAYFDGGDYQKAAANYKAALDLHSNLPAHYGLAVAYMKLERFDDAEEVIRRAIVLDARAFEYYALLGNLKMMRPYHSPDWVNEAIAAYTRAIELNPLLVAARRNLASAYELLGQDDEALLHYESALGLDPSDSETLEKLALQYSRRNDCAMAIGLYQRLVALEPTKPEPHYRLGICLMNQSPPQSITHLKRFLDLAPDSDYGQLARQRLRELQQHGDPVNE